MHLILYKLWFLIAILPYHIAKAAWGKFKNFMDKSPGRWDKLLYVLLGILLVALLVLLALGYRI